MSYVLKCDRCGKVMDESAEGCAKIFAKEILKKYLPQDMEVTKDIVAFDLCPECKMKFNSWLLG